MTRTMVEQISFGVDQVVATVHIEYNPKDPQFAGILNAYFYVDLPAESAKDLTIAQLHDRAKSIAKAWKWPTD